MVLEAAAHASHAGLHASGGAWHAPWHTAGDKPGLRAALHSAGNGRMRDAVWGAATTTAATGTHSFLNHTPRGHGLPILSASHLDPVCTCGLLQLELIVPIGIRPHEPARLRRKAVVRVEFCERTHLAVDVRVPQQQLLAFQTAEVRIAPIQAEGARGLGHEPPLVARKLLEECRLQVHVRAPEAQELHGLSETPTVLLHHVRREDAT
mmetsp:Transcript_45522/g.146101  ORF Transcript_45522/g.146101 Transcript_45522/m.146101 type:complete len:208 (+) Transcript_45522:1242-1865(+)